MTADVGPGTRLLCADDHGSEGLLQQGETYTCLVCLPAAPGEVCLRHGPNCQNIAVRLVEPATMGTWMEGGWCLGRFRPIGGIPLTARHLTRARDLVDA